MTLSVHKVQGNLKPLPGIKNIIAVASGKGGVGKSTVAVNMALALSQQGFQVGLLDADIYGPSIPTMCHLSGRPETNEANKIVPFEQYGLKIMSMGFLVAEDSAMIWRGPMVSGALQQLLNDTSWGELDVLVVDLPPGTGDIQLTLAQKVPVSGAVIVTTPQDIALVDVRRAVAMFNKVGITSLGIVENMSMHTCRQCGHREAVFGEGAADKIKAEFELDCFGQLPLSHAILQSMDYGKPIVAASATSAEGQQYHVLTKRVLEALAKQPKDYTHKFNQIVVE